jgi:threonine synthase
LTTEFGCTQCGAPYPSDGLPYRCEKCGGLFDIRSVPTLQPSDIDPTKPGLWKYWKTFGLSHYPQDLFMGEGNTALVWDNIDGKKVGYKLEYQNATGSYKDRGSSVLTAHLLERNIQTVVEDSSGNAGASLAGYCARSGIHAKIYVPESASGPKRQQIERYGAELVPVPGPRSEAAKQVLQAIQSDIPYASHAYLPFGMAGIETIAYELWEQCDGKVGSVIVPVGHGSLLLGIMRGFNSLYLSGVLEELPMFFGVQAGNCAPVYLDFIGKKRTSRLLSNPTVAEGVRVSEPVRAAEIIKGIKKNNGKIIAVDEENILVSRNQLAKRGIYVEPTSAIVWSAFEVIKSEIPEPVIMIMSGSGYKYSNG